MRASYHSSDQSDHHLAGSLIPQTYLDRLSELGLWLHVAPHCFNHGVRIYKPLSAGGNGNADYEPIELVTFLESDGESKTQTEVDPVLQANLLNGLVDQCFAFL